MTDIKIDWAENLTFFRSHILNKSNWDALDISSFSLAQTYINSRECPFCSSHNVVSKGNYKGRKRYQCRNCGKSFNDLTNTPFSGIHNLDKLKKYLNCLISGYSIRKAATIVGVSVTTSFFWRHRLLDGLKKLPSPKMKNVKEMLEIDIPYSQKGQRTRLSESKMKAKVSVVFICDRNGKLDSDSISFPQRDKNPLFKRIAEITNEHSDFICSPKFLNNMFPLETKIKSSNSNYTKPIIINQIEENWKIWMQRFHGVATKYLSNYLHWFDYLDNTLLSSNKSSNFVQLLLRH